MENNQAQIVPTAEETKSGKIFSLVFIILLFGSVFATYYRIVVQKNYIIEMQTDCDPAEKACFVWECDPLSEIEGEKCTGNAEDDIFYYSLKRRKASNVPLCNPNLDETCDPILCDPKLEKDCAEIFCDEKTKIAQEVECSDPVEYLRNNPPEEEDEEDGEEGEENDEAFDDKQDPATEDEAEPTDVKAEE